MYPNSTLYKDMEASEALLPSAVQLPAPSLARSGALPSEYTTVLDACDFPVSAGKP